jgi:hypothetical protein
MSTTRIAAVLLGGTALLGLAPALAHADTSGPGVKFWTEGALKAGRTIDVYADCGYNKNGVAVSAATVTGPGGMKAALSPLADRGYLGGEITVPAGFTATSATFKLACDNAATGSLTVTSTSKTVNASAAQVATKPKGAAATGELAASPSQGTGAGSWALGLGVGVLALGSVGTGVALRKRANR